MRRFLKADPLRSVTVSTLVAVLLAAPSQAYSASETPPAKPSFVTATGNLTVCNSPGFPPLSYYENPGDAQPVGLDIDLLSHLATSWDAKLKLVAGDFAGLLPALESGRCDMVVSGILLTDERQQKFDGVPYMKTSTLLLAATGNDKISDPESLSGRTLSIEAGTVLQKIADQENEKLKGEGKPEIQVQTYPKAQDCIQQVLVGRSDAALVQDTEAAYRDKQMPGKFKTVYTFPEAKQFAIYVRKGSGDAAIVKASIEALNASGTLKDLLVKWRLPANAGDLSAGQ